MRRLLAFVFVGLAAGAFAQAPDLKNLDLVMRSVPDGPVAKVNGVNIGKDDFISVYKAELGPIAMTFKSQNKEVPDEVRVETAVRSMGMLVQREVLFQEANRLKMSVPEEEVKKAWKQQLDGMMQAYTKAKNQSISEADLLKMAGTSRDEAMAELRKALLIEKMNQEIARQKNVAVTDDEVKKVYAEKKEAMKQPGGFHLMRIYVNTRAKNSLPALNDQQKAEARQKAENGLKRVKAGESFEAVAKAVSEAPDKDRGGDTGFVPPTGLPASYVKVLEAMKPGEVSNVFEDELGFHIVKLIEKQAGGEITLEKAAPRIKQMIMATKTDHAVNEYCHDYMQKAPESVRVFLQLQKTLATNPEFQKMQKQQAAGQKPGEPTAEKPAATKAKKPAADKAEKTTTPAKKKTAAPATKKPVKAKAKATTKPDRDGAS
jgi:parvulin-like peptidyl-prolyl isomerase